MNLLAVAVCREASETVLKEGLEISISPLQERVGERDGVLSVDLRYRPGHGENNTSKGLQILLGDRGGSSSWTFSMSPTNLPAVAHRQSRVEETTS